MPDAHRSSALAIARHSLLATAAAPLLGLVAGFAVMAYLVVGARDLDPSPVPTTWPLMPLALAGLWGGMIAGGGSRSDMVHLLARPVSRTTLAVARIGPLVAMLVAAGIALDALGATLELPGGGPPLWVVAIAIGFATASGIVAGTLAERETAAFGGALLAAGALLAPPFMLVQALGVSWPRIQAIGNGWAGLVTVASIASLGPIIALAWRRLPRRSPQRAATIGSAVVAIAVVHFVTAWLPLGLAASRASSGEAIGIYRVGEYTLLVTGSHVTAIDGRRAVADGLVVVDGEARQAVWQLPLRERLAGARLLEVSPSPSNAAVALVHGTSKSRRLAIVSVPDGRTIVGPDDSIIADVIGDVVWSNDGRLVAVRTESSLAVLSIDGGGELLARVPMPEGLEHAPCPVDLQTGNRDDFVVIGGRMWSGADVVPDPPGGWPGSVCASIPEPDKRLFGIFDGARGHLDHRELSIDPDEGSARVVGTLDADHFVLRAQPDSRLRDAGSNPALFFVDREGRVVARVVGPRGLPVRRVHGPPTGPWIVQRISGEVEAWTRDGKRLWAEQVESFGSDTAPQMPLSFVGDTVEGIDRTGRRWQRPIPYPEDAP